ncbi:MAG: PAS domain S-box protein, partial [Deltaproteobacteria bacterium]|nr:PAS domain S-box protein [Deltaproteobacteria bacterium]
MERELREANTRRTQRQYEAERRTLQRAIGQAPDSIIVTDRDGIIVYANPAMETISGYSKDELIGQKPSLFKSHHHDLRYYENLWQTVLRGEVWRGAIINKRKDGSFWNAESAISPVWDGEGRLVNFVCTGRDTTQEQTLQNQLEQSQRLSSLGTLAAGIAHDFNNLLMPILGYVELAKEHSGSAASLQKDLSI